MARPIDLAEKWKRRATELRANRDVSNWHPSLKHSATVEADTLDKCVEELRRWLDDRKAAVRPIDKEAAHAAMLATATEWFGVIEDSTTNESITVPTETFIEAYTKALAR